MINRINGFATQATINARLESSLVVELVIPGRIMHLVQKGARAASPLDSQHPRPRYGSSLSTCLAQRQYEAFESSFERFQEIAISPSMGLEHFPNAYDEAMAALDVEWRQLSPHAYNKTF